MRVKVYPADAGGCGHYRLIWPGVALAKQGADVEVVFPDNGPETKFLAKFTDISGTPEPIDVDPPDCDVVVLQRPLDKFLAMLIPLFQAKGVKVVVELDDHFHAISPRNKAWAATHPTGSPRRNRLWLEAAVRDADLVTVSTTTLAEYYGRMNPNIHVLRNVVPQAYLDVERVPESPPVIGWSGVLATHPDDLQVVGAAVAKTLRREDCGLAVVGDGKGVNRVLGLGSYPTRVSGWVDLAEYPQAMAQIDIGVVPLERSPFNDAKSWLKGLEFAAVGVPFIATDTAEYNALFNLGIGTLASDPKDWEHGLRALVRDAEWRKELGETNRALVRSLDLTVEARCDMWWDTWEKALK